MSAASVLSQLKGVLQKTEQLVPKFSKVHPTNVQWDDLCELSLKLLQVANEFEQKVRVLKDSRTNRAWKESESYRISAQSARGSLFSQGRLRQPAVFRRNIITIFEGPKDSRFDSEEVRIRKESTRKRCEQIRGLSPDAIVSWALAFAPTLWAGGSLSSDIWPPVIQDTLHMLSEDEESLQKSMEYDRFTKAIDGPSQRNPEQNRKGKFSHGEVVSEDNQLPLPGGTLNRHSSEAGASPYLEEAWCQSHQPAADGQSTRVDGVEERPPMTVSHESGYCSLRQEAEKPDETDSTPPSKENRQMKHMFSNAPASNISRLPEPFRTAVQNSRLWKWERTQNLRTTGCWASLFPKDYSQDASFTIWCGYDDGYRLNDVLGVQHAISS